MLVKTPLGGKCEETNRTAAHNTETRRVAGETKSERFLSTALPAGDAGEMHSILQIRSDSLAEEVGKLSVPPE